MDGAIVDTMATEVSARGLRLVQSQTISEEMEISLQLFMPGNKEPLSLKGKVVFVTDEGIQSGLGIEFVFSDDSTQDDLIAAIEKLRAQEAENSPGHK